MEIRFPTRIILNCWVVAIFAVIACQSMVIAEDEFSNAQIEFFETEIRPLLVNNCLECHGANKSESELRLDSRKAMLRGGASGEPVAIGGSPDKSLMIQSVRHAGDYDMPPNKKLNDEEIASLVTWVEMGMPWPKDSEISRLSMAELMAQHQENHWAFQPVVSPKVPDVKTESGLAIDRLIRQRLVNHHLSPSPRASKATLIRRAYFDLIGLPPSYQEVQDFINDSDPGAYAKLLDRLLASPHYGERWARHWLDVARYADTSGYKLANADRLYPFAFTYRDYVIDALNNDLPYDQFILQQLAADHLEVPDDKHTLAALGFITVGRQYLGRPDTIDDQVDVVTRGLMGLTVSCARCHDHKYDAIPTADYYSLYSVFENNYIPSELPLMGEPSEREACSEYFAKLEELKQQLTVFRAQKYADLRQHIDEFIVDYLVRAVAPGHEVQLQKQEFIKLRDGQLRQKLVDHWRRFLASQFEQNRGVLAPAVELMKLPDEVFTESAAELIATWSDANRATKLNTLVLQAFEARPPQSKFEIGKIYGDLFQTLVGKWKSSGGKQPAEGQFKGAELEIAKVLFHSGSPIHLTEKDLDAYMTLLEQKQIKVLRDKINEHNGNAPSGIRRAMVLRDKENIVEERVMIRGNIHNRGEVAPRQFVALLSGPERAVFKQKSGRLDLAREIASPNNPLTARVLVNRVWMHHFSSPIVDTPSDFGIRCEEPLQRDVLDHLAHGFMKEGWSIKWLHRQIMLSDTYCQASNDRPDCSRTDPENRFYWKMNRRRLEFEPLRDSMLAVAGELDRTLHGKAVDLQKRPYSNRRTIYGLIDRQDLPGLFRVFDLANPDQSAARRTRTTVPQQSLFMLNSEFTMRLARRLVARIPPPGNGGRKQRIVSIYRTVFQRDPSPEEMQAGLDFLNAAIAEWEKRNKLELEGPKSATAPKQALTPWQRYAQILMCMNEFEYID